MPRAAAVPAGETRRIALPRPHAGQRRVADSRARYRVVMCGRRWGKSTHGVLEAALVATAGAPVGWFAPNYKYSTWDTLVSILRPITVRSNATERRLELSTGGVIDVWTLDAPDAGRGRMYALVVIDEAGLVADLDAQWSAAIRATLTDLRGRALFLGTPKGASSAFVRLFRRAEQDGVEWAAFRSPTADNPHIPPDEIEAARRDLPPAIFAQEYEAVPSEDGGNPFGLAAIARVVGGSPWPAAGPGREPMVWGWDFGRAQDWTVGVALDQLGQVVRVERWQGLPWDETIRRVVACLGTTPGWGDATGVGDPVVEAIQRQAPLERYVFTRPAKQALMQRLAAAIHAGTVQLPPREAAPWLVSELESFTFSHTVSGVRYTAPDGLHDDGVMALALAVFGADRVGVGTPVSSPLDARPYDPRRDPTDVAALFRVQYDDDSPDAPDPLVGGVPVA